MAGPKEKAPEIPAKKLSVHTMDGMSDVESLKNYDDEDSSSFEGNSHIEEDSGQQTSTCPI